MKTALKRTELRWLRASLASSCHFFDKSDAPKEANLTETIQAPKIRELIEKLKAAIERHKSVVAELRSAEANLRSNAEQVGLLQNRLAERNMELARSGSQPPEDPFEEEALITKVSSKGRFYEARVQLRREAVASSLASIEDLRAALRPAFTELGRELLQNSLIAFEEAAKATKDAYIEAIAIKHVCNLPSFYMPGVVIGRLPISKAGGEGAFLHSERLEARHLYGDAHDALQTLRAEIEQMVTCQVEPPLIDGAAAASEQSGSGLVVG